MNSNTEWANLGECQTTSTLQRYCPAAHARTTNSGQPRTKMPTRGDNACIELRPVSIGLLPPLPAQVDCKPNPKTPRALYEDSRRNDDAPQNGCMLRERALGSAATRTSKHTGLARALSDVCFSKNPPVHTQHDLRLGLERDGATLQPNEGAPNTLVEERAHTPIPELNCVGLPSNDNAAHARTSCRNHRGRGGGGGARSKALMPTTSDIPMNFGVPGEPKAR